ncbi:MAG TPA: hypothetical protein VK706_12225 [Candidatus Sulfotelmatobacter sp.]|nr:hypothetical protein [Candidatus Sulfotelmatobacter sp.]
MFRRGNTIFGVQRVVLGAALLAYPWGMLAQHGGGGSIGGGGAGGGGLSGSSGRASGVSTKDDLKDFRAALAVQATSQQVVEYTLMEKSAAAADAELQGYLALVSKPNAGSELASRGTILDQALERARTENRKFLDGLSERQKSGLREITKKLSKADSDLEQQTKALDQVVGDTKSVAQQIAGSGQSLEHALTVFRSQQADLGKEMNVGAADDGANSAYAIPRMKNSVNLGGQSISITTWGEISAGVAEGGQNTFKLQLTADLSDLQNEIGDLLRAQLNKADRCGEQIAVRSASLAPQEPASLVVVQLHFERWACFGRDTVNEMAEGNGTIEVKLTPAVGEDGTLQLRPEVGRISAEGLVGELLRSGSLGEAVRDAVAQSILTVMRQGGDFKVMLPDAAQGYATLRRAQFQGTGSGKLIAVWDGDIRVSDEKATALTSALKGQRSLPESQQENKQENLPQAVPR